MGVLPHQVIRTSIVLALCAGSLVARAEPGPDELMALGDTHLLADAFESAIETYGRVSLSPGRLALPLLAQAEAYERWGHLGKAARSYRKFLARSRRLLPAVAEYRLEARESWLAWNHATFKSRKLIRSGARLLALGAALGGLGALSYVGGRRLLANSELDLNAIIGGIILSGLGVVGFSLGGVFGLTGLINFFRAAALRGAHSEEPRRPPPLPEAPAWRTLIQQGGERPLSAPPLVRPPTVEAPLSPPPIKVLP